MSFSCFKVSSSICLAAPTLEESADAAESNAAEAESVGRPVIGWTSHAHCRATGSLLFSSRPERPGHAAMMRGLRRLLLTQAGAELALLASPLIPTHRWFQASNFDTKWRFHERLQPENWLQIQKNYIGSKENKVTG